MVLIPLTPLREPPEQILSLLEQKAKLQYKENVLLIGVKGSLAHGNFTLLSDIDMVVILRDCTEHYKEFMYGTTYIDVRIVSLPDALRDIRKVTLDWPLRVGGLLGIKAHYEKEKVKAKLVEEYHHIQKIDHLFTDAIDLHSFTEYYSKAYRAHQEDDSAQLIWAAVTLSHEFALIIALLNKKYYISQGPLKYAEQIEQFDYKPDGWKEALENTMSRDKDKSMEGIHQMWKILNLLSIKHKFATKRITSLEDIQL